ncbi:hypothetical protein MZO42_00430 [Sphingomonas psychrotolerans]|uniref:Uncharacterized protein n=1 Tax=Sphingomonas psychrotolerans TaxID=1327635 RepID=A0ABU3MXU9_9SPHN|nr:hypothetical protein [Sphingomonas psychrotolerans]MDT8757150.1 hypothetical protein [Sphingomonas psychrotolerans]
MTSHFCAAVLAAFVAVSPLSAAAQVTAVAPAESAIASAPVSIAAGTPVEIEFTTPLSSKTAKIDDMFRIRLTSPIVLNDKVVVPVGTLGTGQIVHAAKAGGGGKAGELIVTVRWLDHLGTRIPLRRLRMGGLDRGADRREGAFGVSMAVPFAGFFVRGGEKTIEPGTLANAIVAADVAVTPAATFESAAAN